MSFLVQVGKERGRIELRYGFMRAMALFCMISLSAGTLYILLNLSANYRFSNMSYQAASGVVDLSDYDFRVGAPVSLRGQWEFYPGVFLRDEQSLAGHVFDAPQMADVPANGLYASSALGTYRLRFRVGAQPLDYSMLLPCENDVYYLYVNGALVRSPYDDGASPRSAFFYATCLHQIALDPAREYQEIVISANGRAGDSLLYKSTPLLGSRDTMSDVWVWAWGNSLFEVGLLIVLLLNGLLFMVIRPRHVQLNLLTVFDMLFIFRVLLGIYSVRQFIMQSLPFLPNTDMDLMRVQYALIFWGCVAGLRFIMSVTDHRAGVERYVVIGFSTLLLAMSAACFVIPIQWEGAANMGLLAVYLIALPWLCLRLVQRYRAKPNRVFLFLIIKCMLIFGTILLDILGFAHAWFSFRVIIYLYLITFLTNLVFRLLEFNSKYNELSAFNANLENIVRERTVQLTEANHKLALISERDPLTGAYNRLYFDEKIREMIERQAIAPFSLYLAMFDLDHFKRINDQFGHDEGDETLCEFARIVTQALDERTSFARVGGEEFVLLLRDMTSEQAHAFIEALRVSVESNARDNPRRTTASFGLVRYRTGMSFKAFMKRADECLYEAKNGGRNRTVAEV